MFEGCGFRPYRRCEFGEEQKGHQTKHLEGGRFEFQVKLLWLVPGQGVQLTHEAPEPDATSPQNKVHSDIVVFGDSLEGCSVFGVLDAYRENGLLPKTE